MCETLKGIKGLLHRCERLLRPDGQLLVNSVKEPEVANAQIPKGYPRELEFRLSHERNVGPWMRWLHVDFETLFSKANEYGWFTEKLIDDSDGSFLARLSSL